MLLPGTRVLVVDDDDAIRVALCSLLSDEGALVAQASSGAEALDWLSTHRRPHVVLLDLVMPGMSGLDLLAELRSHPSLATLPVVLMTALHAHPSLDRLADAWVRKPPRAGELLAVLARCVLPARAG